MTTEQATWCDYVESQKQQNLPSARIMTGMSNYSYPRGSLPFHVSMTYHTGIALILITR